MVFRLILPTWAKEASPNLPKALEGEFTEQELKHYNLQGYNIYFLPNHPADYQKGTIVNGSHIDVFNYVYVDMDLKDEVYPSKESFVSLLLDQEMKPTFIVDSGNGIHAYWATDGLDAMSFLRFQRRLIKKFKTDITIAKLYQLMRYPGSVNTKDKENPKLCEIVYSEEVRYTCEQVDNFLPPILLEDEEYCKQHYNKTYKIDDVSIKVDDRLPIKFAKLIESSQEAREIWSGNTDDRSKSDFRLGHLMFANQFTRDEALSVLVNSQKALGRSSHHKVNYALGIVDKIWTFELTGGQNELSLSSSVKDILAKGETSLKGTRFPCHTLLDATVHGFRLGQVIGLVAGSGVGKTAMALNMFKWFVERNPEYTHFFVPLEQPENEIAERWKTMCEGDTSLHDKVQVISNYDSEGNFRHLSLTELRDYIVKFTSKTGKKAGCVVIDHIGALAKKGENEEQQGIMDICHEMKAFAVKTNTLLVMQSQSSREKAGIGDLELNKDAAYGTVYFESYCDYLITIWQPLKRCYSNTDCPTVTAFKFCKIRHKKTNQDKIQEDVPYRLLFNPKNERLQQLTQKDEIAFDFWNKMATNKRKEDRKTDIVKYESTAWTEEEKNGEVSNNKNITRVTNPEGIH